MKRVLLALALTLGLSTQAQAAATWVQTAFCSGNDATCTFGSAPSASNLIIVMSTLESTANTLSITDWTHAEVTWIGPFDATGVRGYVFCTVGDGADTTMILTTSVNAGARTMALEVAGAGTDCTEATSSDDNETGITDPGGTTHALTTDMTGTVAGTFHACHAGSANSANFTAGWSPTATVDAANLEIGGIALGSYKEEGSTGTFACGYTSAASEVAVIMGVLVKPTAGGADPLIGLRSLLGVGK